MIINPYVYGGAVCNPLSISGLQLWLKASALSLSDGDPVTTWTDSSGQSHDNTGVSATKPTFQANVINGLPVVHFYGTNTGFSYGNWASGYTAGHAFVLAKINADPPSLTQDTGWWDWGAQDASTHHPYTDGVIYEGFGTSARKTTVDPTVDMSTNFRLYEVTAGSNDYHTLLDGTVIFNDSSNTVSFPAAPVFGWNNNLGGTSYGLLGDVAEFLFFNVQLNSTNAGHVRSYIADTYALTIANTVTC